MCLLKGHDGSKMLIKFWFDAPVMMMMMMMTVVCHQEGALSVCKHVDCGFSSVSVTAVITALLSESRAQWPPNNVTNDNHSWSLWELQCCLVTRGQAVLRVLSAVHKCVQFTATLKLSLITAWIAHLLQDVHAGLITYGSKGCKMCEPILFWSASNAQTWFPKSPWV